MASSSSANSFSFLNYLNLLLFRPLLAISFVLSFIVLGWWLAWKLILVHVPLIQDICGLRKKPIKSKPSTRRRFSRFYNAMNRASSSSEWFFFPLILILLSFE